MFLLQHCVLRKFYVIGGQNAHYQCGVLCIPIILNGSLNECWLATYSVSAAHA